jgi:glucose-1-phosphate adenylyltransferase
MTSHELTRTQTFILAGGRGERLHPLTVSRPKPAVAFGGLFRIIDFTLSNCLNAGLSRVSLLTQHDHDRMHSYIRSGWSEFWERSHQNGSSLACVPPTIGKRYRGTADAVFQNIQPLDADPCEFVLVLSGDHIYNMDYREMLLEHKETGADLTIATIEYPLQDASHFGVVQVDENFEVIGFAEKPSNPQSLASRPTMALVSMGIYVFKKTALLDALRSCCDAGGYDFGHDVIPALIQSVRTYAYDFRDPVKNSPRYWRDIGTLDAYYQANMDLLKTDPSFDPYLNETQPSFPTRHPAPRHELRARLHMSSRVAQSVLSPGVRIEAGAEIEESILLPGACIGKNAPQTVQVSSLQALPARG